jgi:hypothetical protein
MVRQPLVRGVTYYVQVRCEMRTVTSRAPVSAVRPPGGGIGVALPQPSSSECVVESAATGEDR